MKYLLDGGHCEHARIRTRWRQAAAGWPRAARAAGGSSGGCVVSDGAQQQVPEKISRFSFIFAIIGLGVLVLSLLYCAYIVFTAVHSDHPEGGGFVWIIPFVVYMCVLPPINLAGLILGFLKVGPSVSGRQRMWSLLGIGLNVLPWVIAAVLLVWIRTSVFPGTAGALLALG